MRKLVIEISIDDGFGDELNSDVTVSSLKDGIDIHIDAFGRNVKIPWKWVVSALKERKMISLV